MSKYDVRVGDKVILREKEWEGIYPENAIVGKVYTIIPEDIQYGDLIIDESMVQITIFTEYNHYEDFELYQTNTKVTDVEIGDIVEVVVLDSRQTTLYPEMTKLLGKRGVVKDKRAYLDVKFDDEVDEAIWAIHYHCVRVVENDKPKPDDVLEPLPDSSYKRWDDVEDTMKPTDIQPTKPKQATEFLSKALSLLSERGKEYDKPEGERSMSSCVTAFNAITGKDLKESEGWLLLQLLKDTRQWLNPDKYHADSAEDCISYAALKAEALYDNK